MTDLEPHDNIEVTVYYGKHESDLKRALAESLDNILRDLSIMTLEDALFYEIGRLRND